MAEPTFHPSAQIAPDATVRSGAVVGANVRIGPRSVIGHGVVLHEDTVVGADVTVFDHAVLGRRPLGVGSMTRPPRTDLGPLQLGDGCVVGAGAVLYRGTTIGRETLLGDLCSIREECVVGDRCIIARGVTVNYATRIGHRVKIQDNTHLTGNMVIEDGVFVSVLVATTNDNSMDRGPHDPAKLGGPVIRRGASIGAGAVLLPGVTIGEFAVVGAGAVVSQDVPPRQLVAGNPARVVKPVPAEWLPKEEMTPPVVVAPRLELPEFIEAFAWELQIAPGPLSAATRLADVPRFDSMGRLAFMAMIDTRLGLVLDADALDGCATLGELHALVTKTGGG
jgi:acetyltransferase-like isoleucine patch superfamily enzyme